MKLNELVLKKDFLQKQIYPFTNKSNFSNLGSVIKNSSNIKGSRIVVSPNDSISGLLG